MFWIGGGLPAQSHRQMSYRRTLSDYWLHLDFSARNLIAVTIVDAVTCVWWRRIHPAFACLRDARKISPVGDKMIPGHKQRYFSKQPTGAQRVLANPSPSRCVSQNTVPHNQSQKRVKARCWRNKNSSMKLRRADRPTHPTWSTPRAILPLDIWWMNGQCAQLRTGHDWNKRTLTCSLLQRCARSIQGSPSPAVNGRKVHKWRHPTKYNCKIFKFDWKQRGIFWFNNVHLGIITRLVVVSPVYNVYK